MLTIPCKKLSHIITLHCIIVLGVSRIEAHGLLWYSLSGAQEGNPLWSMEYYKLTMSTMDNGMPNVFKLLLLISHIGRLILLTETQRSKHSISQMECVQCHECTTCGAAILSHLTTRLRPCPDSTPPAKSSIQLKCLCRYDFHVFLSYA